MVATVLIVDDSMFQRHIIRRTLEQEGYSLLEASGGREALEMVAAHAPDCVLLDILMPDVSGLDVLVELQAKGIQVPVIVLSADIQTSTRRRCLELGAIAVIHKPYQSEALCDLVHQAVEKGGRR